LCVLRYRRERWTSRCWIIDWCGRTRGDKGEQERRKCHQFFFKVG